MQLVAERHLQKQVLSSKQRRLWDHGWDWHGEAAAGTGRGGTSGGTAVLVRRHLDHRPGAVFQSQGAGWTQVFLRLKQWDLALFSLYLKVDTALHASPNVDVLHELAAAIRVLSCPFLVLGDWNAEPEDVVRMNGLSYCVRRP